jgi:HD domain
MTASGDCVSPVALARALVQDPVAAFDTFGPRISELRAMADCPQPANHHSEGSVWAHTRLALRMYADLGAHVEAHAGRALRDAGCWPLDLGGPTLTRTVAVLLHDVGKPPTRSGPVGAWTYYGHERAGADLARALLGRLRLAEGAAAVGAQLDVDTVCWLIRDHLFWLNTDVQRVTDRAVARRYVDDPERGDDLRVLSWSDTLGSRGPDGSPHVDLLVAAEQRIAATRRRAAIPPTPPPLRGEVVMNALGLEPGPRIGAVLAWLEHRELAGGEARAALARHREVLRERSLAHLRAGGEL